jgi:MFS family permease
MSDENAARSTGSEQRVSGYAWYALILFVVVYIFNFIDRQIVSILAESIKADLKLDDAQIGFLYGTAFAIFYALFGIPLGRLADSWYRGRLMAIGLALWSSMTALSGLAQSFGMLAAARVGVGIGEASASPAAYSMIADYFPKEKRATALSIYSSGLYIGGGIALPLGGFVLAWWARNFPASAIAPWQAAFLAVGLPGLLLAIWIWSLKEPLRGAIDGHPSNIVQPNAWPEFGRELVAIIPPLTILSAARLGALRPNLLMLSASAIGAFLLGKLTGDWPQWMAWFTGVYAVFSWTQSLKRRDPATHTLIWGTPIAVMLVVAFGSISFMTYAVAFWIPPYLLRTFYTGPTGPAVFLEGATAAEEVSALFGWSAAAASAVGVILGGILSDRLRQHFPGGRLYVNMAAIILPAPAIYWGFTTDRLATFYTLAPYVSLCSALWVGAAVATLQDLVLPRMRGTAGATYVLGTSLVGLALGPYYVGKVAAITGNLATGIFALYVLPPFTLAALWIASRRIDALEATREERAASA